MNVRSPSVRHPRTFYDLFGTAAIGVAIMAAILTLWHGTVVRIEMAVFLAVLFIWAIWAVNEILERAADTPPRRIRR